MSESNYLPDPIQGTIELPQWLVTIKDEPAVRRMMFIRQLGLKAFIDFPGAIHTRYSHALGTMHLSGQMADMLSEKMAKNRKHIIAKNLEQNKNNIMAAGFLHDIAHAPFSHAADFILKRITSKSHEDLAEDIIKNKIPAEIEDWGINKNSVVQLIKNKGHRNPFLGQIINGPIDCDKLDYLLRDAYHVGLKYGFDLNYFLRSYTVIGDESHLGTCILGLDSTKRAVVTTDVFIVIWKSMYDLVYLVEQSRIAEKMLEKAFLLSITEQNIKQMFGIDKFIFSNDENMLAELEKLKEDSINQLLAPENPRRLYLAKIEKELNEKNYKMTASFLAQMEEDPDELSEKMSLSLAEHLKLEKYNIICDIVKTKAPKEIYLSNNEDTELEKLLRDKSDIVGYIKAKNILKIYVKPTLIKALDYKEVEQALKGMIEGEIDVD
jgi:uncharacterized protein